MKRSKWVAAILALLVAATTALPALAQQPAIYNITITPSEVQGEISPYIYGVNSGVDLSKVSAGAFRLGGNRLSAYNWENNMSNAGSDWHNSADLYLVQGLTKEFKESPGGAALAAAKEAQEGEIPYVLLTLQMLGYASSAKTGQVPKTMAAPSAYWNKVLNRKESALTLEPDQTDGVVYMDDYLHYLISKLGSSESETGIKAYALDNEPSLWQHTHSLVQQEPLRCDTLVEKSVALASLVKEMDGGADVFGPSLFGYSAFVSLMSAPDWEELRKANNYRWFIDYYLDAMKQASDDYGTRLLDVLDIHYYTEAKGVCGERSCNHYDNDGCIQARLDSVRSLYDAGYAEDSWITDIGAEFFPLLPNVQQSIDQYYPDTKLAFTEYNFGGGDHISGAVTQAEVLGVFAESGVYFASLWSFDQNEFQLAAINMFTNYDGAGSGFGDTLVKSEGENEKISVYASTDGKNEDVVKIMVLNRSLHEETSVQLAIASDAYEYSEAEVYMLLGDDTTIRTPDEPAVISENSIAYQLPPLSVTEFVVRGKKQAAALPFSLPVMAGVGIGVAAVAAVIIAMLLRARKKKSALPRE